MEEIKNSEDNIGKTRKKPTRRKEGEIEKKERVEKVENFDKKAEPEETKKVRTRRTSKINENVLVKWYE